MKYQFLTSTDFETLYNVFIKSFSDYIVKMQPTKEQFKEMLTRRGVEFDISIGAYDGSELVGFNLNAIGLFNSEMTVYDCGTGIIPEFRGKGIVKELFKNSYSTLGKYGASKYLLEVIEGNIAAIKVYKRLGFKESRFLQCFRLNTINNKHLPQNLNLDITLVIENNPAWELFQSFLDYQPSWQNTVESICRSKEDKLIVTATQDNKILGYGVLYPNSGDIPQIAVVKEHKGKLVGETILSSLIHHSKSETVKVINVDSSATETIKLLNNMGFQQFVNQYEMVLEF